MIKWKMSSLPFLLECFGNMMLVDMMSSCLSVVDLD